MRANRICGAKRRGKPWRSTRPAALARRRPELVDRDLTAAGPNQLSAGVVFVAFIDAYSRRILRWQLAGQMRTTLVLDALRMALHQRGPGADVELVHHSNRGSQTHLDRPQTLADHGVLASVGSLGDAHDNALAESFLDTFKTEPNADRVWRTRSQLELATVEYPGWFNPGRPHAALDDRPPAEFKAPRPPRPQTTTPTDRSTETT